MRAKASKLIFFGQKPSTLRSSATFECQIAYSQKLLESRHDHTCLLRPRPALLFRVYQKVQRFTYARIFKQVS